ncbi:helix-turn-helix transcriptional regulator [Escherichia coli]|nr:helix-turn-helix transcriptional regulator [Escherichia coli]EGJ4568231.1 helix-turn-helix transcriptional regulator [Escherichia coli]EGJ4573035.1 helix-turn-helix transcriptional regulator [Escherichia coli]EGJ4602191.1 helix-turn-helix transcriptional regulator [Escherichia coli]EGJ4621032.1 helix-turn-helix transcriptional regulator [Escherichia coli]
MKDRDRDRDREKEIIQTLKMRILLLLKKRRKISLKEISLMSGFSIKHTQVLFHKQNGTTIGKYIKQCLFSKAVILLVLTRKSILDISLDVGFSSQQSFSRAFKNEFSLSPMKYRNRGVIDSKKLISEFQPGDKFILDGELYLPSIKTRTTFIRFTDNILTTGNILTKNRRLQKIKSSLSQTDSLLIISSISPIKNEPTKVHINSFFCSTVETGEEISTINGIYYKVIFNGSLDDYINIGRNIVFYINIPFPLEIIEEVKRNEDKLTITIFIPKKR